MWLYSKEKMAALEAEEIRRGTPERVLMERAAEALAAEAAALMGGAEGGRAAVFCGRGKNGGDGYGAARLLRAAGAEVKVYAVAGGELAALTSVMRDGYLADGGAEEPFERSSRESMEFCSAAAVIIDAVYGIGFHGNLRGAALEAARVMNISRAPVVSADLPSGVAADGAASEHAVRADVTAAFGRAKPAHFIEPGRSLSGRVVTAEIGISPEAEKAVGGDVRLVGDDFLCEKIAPRRRDSHKGDYGSVLIVGGSMGFTGAPQLAAEGALRAGAGLVYMAAPECVYPIMASGLREAICFPVPSAGGGYAAKAAEEVLERAKQADVVVLGPGLGRSKESDRFAAELILGLKCTLVLDADGINLAASNINILRGRKAPTIVTPHDVEFARLGGSLEAGRLAGARGLAEATHAVTVLKGGTTVVAVPDGETFVAASGNPGMAKGGSGDVLAGVIAGLAAGGLSPADAAAAGAYIHGRAGSLAAEELGEFGMLPSDLLRKLPLTLKGIVPRK